jgi:hypothetical protein
MALRLWLNNVHRTITGPTAEVIKGIYETKICVAKPHSPDACEGKIVAAHTIPRSHLRQIAANGHVYAMAATVADLVRHDGTLSAMKYGIGDFSVLNCFCATHDNNVFTFCGVGFDHGTTIATSF